MLRLGCLPILLFFPLALLAIWVVSLIEVLKRPDETFKDNTERVMWILIVFFGNFIGAIIYQLFGKNR